MPDSFTLRDLASAISMLLDLKEGNYIEIQRDRLNPNIIIIKHPTKEIAT